MKSCRSFVRESRISPRIFVWKSADYQTETIHILHRDHIFPWNSIAPEKKFITNLHYGWTKIEVPYMLFSYFRKLPIRLYCKRLDFQNNSLYWILSIFKKWVTNMTEPNWAQTSSFLYLERELFWKHAPRCMWYTGEDRVLQNSPESKKQHLHIPKAPESLSCLCNYGLRHRDRLCMYLVIIAA